jgi:hypothetical protein
VCVQRSEKERLLLNALLALLSVMRDEVYGKIGQVIGQIFTLTTAHHLLRSFNPSEVVTRPGVLTPRHFVKTMSHRLQYFDIVPAKVPFSDENRMMTAQHTRQGER